jgi:hypothetical protein
MTPQANRLLCIDLQVDALPDHEPDPKSVSGARQLLSLGRRLGWQIVHARRRTQPVIRARDGSTSAGLNPLMSEKVFFHDGRSVAESPGLSSLLHEWRNDAVYVAAFDHVALLSCLLACYEPGPRMVLIEDVISLDALGDTSAIDAFHGAAWRLAFGKTGIAGIIADAKRRGGPSALLEVVGERPGGMPV